MGKMLQGFMTVWDVQEMPAKNRSYHVIKHVYNERERWWKIGSWFTRQHIDHFKKELTRYNLKIDLKTDPQLRKLIKRLPRRLHQELNDVYEQEYKQVALNVIKTIDHENTFTFNEHTQKHGLAIHIYTKQDILVVLKAIPESDRELYWATSYRPRFSHKTSNPKKFERFVRNLKESELY